MKEYNHGIVLGKFMPLHLGHEHLINTAIEHCNKVTVVVCSLSTEPIAGELRFRWMENRYRKEIMDNIVNVVHLKEDWIPQKPEDCYSKEVFYGTWAGTLKALAKDSIDVIFTSEDYGDPVAEYLQCEHFLVDKERIKFPVSGTSVRNNPFQNWNFLNENVKKHFIKKILIIGAESTGKSTLTTNLATYFSNEKYKAANIQEYARSWIDAVLAGNMGKLQFEHITHFGKSQMQLVKDAVEHGDFPLVFSDTDAIVSSVFQEIYYGKIDDELLDEVKKENSYWDLILFTNSDVPWVDDGQRNLQDRREEVSRKFLSLIQKIGSPYVVIEGNWKQRYEKAIDAVNKLLKV